MKDEANKSPIRYQLCAAVLKAKKMVGKPCCNTNRNIIHGFICGSAHAEVNALISFFGKDMQYNRYSNKWCILSKKKNAKNLDIIVIRFNHSGCGLNSRPCYKCLDMMKDIGIGKVYYTTSNNDLICEHVKDMISIQSSYRIGNPLNDKVNYLLFSEKLLITIFPKNIKIKNLLCFIDYNFINIFPHYKVIITNNNVVFRDSTDKIILHSLIII
jgi:deoxycytidylate deaminase